MSTALLDRLEPGIARVTMNRPERLNAISPELISDLLDRFAEIRDDPSIRVVILTGAGRGFCAGADLKSESSLDESEHTRLKLIYDMQVRLCDLMLAIHELPVPVIAAVNGPAVGGGFALALHCDVRIAAPAARFGSVFIKVGLSSLDVGTSYLLPKLVGAGRARELMLTGRVFDLDEAAAIGLVEHRSDTDDALIETAAVTARQIAENNEYGVWMTKLGLNANLDAPSLRHAMEIENRTQVLGTFTGNMTEASQAFRDGRKPDWKRL